MHIQLTGLGLFMGSQSTETTMGKESMPRALDSIDIQSLISSTRK